MANAKLPSDVYLWSAREGRGYPMGPSSQTPGVAPYPWAAPQGHVPLREMHPVIHPWPPHPSLQGPLIGWDKDHQPYIVYKTSYGPEPGCWRALGLHVPQIPPTDDHGLRPIAYVIADDNEDLIKTWTHNFGGPDPNGAAREMQIEEYKEQGADYYNKVKAGSGPIPSPGVYGVSTPHTLAEYEERKNGYLRSLFDKILGKK